VINNTIKFNEERGIRVRGCYNHEINNFVKDSHKGIRLDENKENDRVEGNRIVGNILVGNNAENCQVQGDKNWIINNLAYTGEEEGFLIEGNGNWIKNNTALNCGKEDADYGGGFVGALGTSGNYFFNNTALDNFPNDLIDENGACVDNKWFNNRAVTGEPECTIPLP
jgi:hypothetical protein